MSGVVEGPEGGTRGVPEGVVAAPELLDEALAQSGASCVGWGLQGFFLRQHQGRQVDLTATAVILAATTTLEEVATALLHRHRQTVAGC